MSAMWPPPEVLPEVRVLLLRVLAMTSGNTEADRMTAYWTWWRLAWHSFIGHELTNNGDDYPAPVCRTCELKRLHDARGK